MMKSQDINEAHIKNIDAKMTLEEVHVDNIDANMM
jgi:hypothetical protein